MGGEPVLKGIGMVVCRPRKPGEQDESVSRQTQARCMPQPRDTPPKRGMSPDCNMFLKRLENLVKFCSSCECCVCRDMSMKFVSFFSSYDLQIQGLQVKRIGGLT